MMVSDTNILVSATLSVPLAKTDRARSAASATPGYNFLLTSAPTSARRGWTERLLKAYGFDQALLSNARRQVGAKAARCKLSSSKLGGHTVVSKTVGRVHRDPSASHSASGQSRKSLRPRRFNA